MQVRRDELRLTLVLQAFCKAFDEALPNTHNVIVDGVWPPRCVLPVVTLGAHLTQPGLQDAVPRIGKFWLFSRPGTRTILNQVANGANSSLQPATSTCLT